MTVLGVLPVLLVLLVGIALGYGLASLLQRGGKPSDVDQSDAMRALLQDSIRFKEQAARIPGLEEEKRALNEQLIEAREKLAAEEAGRDGDSRRHEEQLNVLAGARQEFTNHFKTLAAEIMDERVARLTEQNKAGLREILDPLRAKLGEFQQKVEEVYVQEGKDRSALGEQVRQLLDLNQTLSREAHGLTQALKGSSKTQGIWGEMILETILESAGLRKGEEYELRPTVHRDDGSRAQPDVLVHLPDGKTIVVDSKVSLTAYEKYANTEDVEERAEALKAHLISVRGHIAELSDKSYQTLPGGERFDAVVMFVPLEPAFMVAIGAEPRIWQEAWSKNVILVGPSMLLFALRTISQLWKQEQQSRNAQEIAKRGAELYDKLVGFVSDLEAVSDRLRQAEDSCSNALKKLSSGKGNVIRQAEMLKDLGVKPNKMLPTALVGRASESRVDNGKTTARGAE